MFKTNNLVILNNWLLIWFREIEFPATVGTFMIFSNAAQALYLSWNVCGLAGVIKALNCQSRKTCTGRWAPGKVWTLYSLSPCFFQAVMRPKHLLELQQHWDGFLTFFFSICLSARRKKFMLAANSDIAKHIRKASVVFLGWALLADFCCFHTPCCGI